MTNLVRPPDEFANCLTHAFGFLLSLAAAAYLIARVAGQSAEIIVACWVNSTTLVLVYASSTLSHSFYELSWRRRCRTWDQASIFLLIAGTYTPLGVMYLNRGPWQWLLVVMWGLAGLGVMRAVKVCDLSRWDKLSYGFLGCLPVVAVGELSQSAPREVVVGTVVGGVAYLLGIPFLCQSASVRYSHALWHVLVMVGSACHYWAIVVAVEAYRR